MGGYYLTEFQKGKTNLVKMFSTALLFCTLISITLADPASDLVECLGGGSDLDSCTARTWKLELFIPKLKTTGAYQLSGKFPPNLDLGSSTGDERLQAKDVGLTADMKLGTRAGGKLLIKELVLDADFNNIDLELECLFPRDGKCCPQKYLKSCSPGLARLVHIFINQKKNFVDNFQPGITRKMGEILKDYINKAIANLDAKYVIDL